MKQHLSALLYKALSVLRDEHVIAEIPDKIQVDNTKDKAHGDLASNIAMVLAKPNGMNPRVLAGQIIGALPADAALIKAEIAGPGFINFFLNESTRFAVLEQILAQQDAFGRSSAGGGASVQVEFVSANPTGPLHVGHGRGAAYGACVANLLEAVGYDVHREYYVNDAGRQMDILATSVWLRYLSLCEVGVVFPRNAYQGDYIWTSARNLLAEYGEDFKASLAEVMTDVPPDEGQEGGDKELHVDGLIANAKSLLGETDYQTIHKAALDVILKDIREDLAEFGVTYQDWFSERSLFTSGLVDAAIEKLQAAGHMYEQEGALWFRSTDFGDEKDRVVVRDNGLKTYFASDIAYHLNKLEQGHEKVINIWGSDHHGYIPRVRAALKALGEDDSKLEVLLVQFAVLYRGGEKAAMSTRSGQFVTLRELREEVGNDATRYFYASRKSEQHMDFDLDLAKSKSNENPVYYIQYAHARICAVWRQLAEQGLSHDVAAGLAHVDLLTTEQEGHLVDLLGRYTEVVYQSGMRYEPHTLANYLKDLAHGLHSYYNAHKFLIDDENLRNARLTLIKATQQVLRNALTILGMRAPEEM
jgi:arginyl-tRNA synthetase